MIEEKKFTKQEVKLLCLKIMTLTFSATIQDVLNMSLSSGKQPEPEKAFSKIIEYMEKELGDADEVDSNIGEDDYYERQREKNV
jgi:hypothetical protein